MVFFIKPLAALLIAFAAIANAQQAANVQQDGPSISGPATTVVPSATAVAPTADPLTLPVGVYYRPSGDEVSGREGATARFVRSPCPALNTLANHGFLPRDGKNIPKDLFMSVLMGVLNLDRGLASFQTTLLKRTTSLSDLGRHNFIEHDFSVVHSDAFYQRDPAAVDANLAADLVARAVDGALGVKQLADASVVRMATCTAKPSGCGLSGFHRSLAFREQASILRVFGGANAESCRVEFAQSFLVEERFPVEWRKPSTQVRLADLTATGNSIQRAMAA